MVHSPVPSPQQATGIRGKLHSTHGSGFNHFKKFPVQSLTSSSPEFPNLDSPERKGVAGKYARTRPARACANGHTHDGGASVRVPAQVGRRRLRDVGGNASVSTHAQMVLPRVGWASPAITGAQWPTGRGQVLVQPPAHARIHCMT